MLKSVFINGKEFKVSLRVYVIHHLNKSKRLQPTSFYNEFSRDYVVSRDTFDTIYFMVNGRTFPKAGILVYEDIIKRCNTSVDSTIWLCQFFNLTVYKVIQGVNRMYYFDLMFDKYINYPVLLSQDFNSIKTLLSFYKHLIYSYSKEGISCNYYIPINLINHLLVDLDSNLTEEDIKKDLNTHGIISKVDDSYYEWINKPVLKWLSNLDSLRLQELNQYKLFRDL